MSGAQQETSLFHLHLPFSPLQFSPSPYSFPSPSQPILQSARFSLPLFHTVSPSLAPCLSIKNTHMTLCQILLLDLGGCCVFFSSRFSPLFFSMPAWESHLINTSTQSRHFIYTHWLHYVCVCVCRYKCKLIVPLIFSFIPSPLLSCQEAVSLCIYKSLFFICLASLQTPPLFLCLRLSYAPSNAFPSLTDSFSLSRNDLALSQNIAQIQFYISCKRG